jgi:hypothetical protein
VIRVSFSKSLGFSTTKTGARVLGWRYDDQSLSSMAIRVSWIVALFFRIPKAELGFLIPCRRKGN